ncbi:hypothetical protein, variant [Aphanomyces invadans]|uniref:Uncharacterized protein n=1 Tax=Aphanomyces invadans TaxID=157072 RepID=A0A024UKM6_9STRA|nr:hypothetical protein H310_03758 [Aphanomyces invadans]XP_008865961.1 hypothetical protein, variant [Aphanomyces invadans]ETW06183.1 hypothetical protein H310_03758 [Aphanomyces invadans]ETW06184.1 hypothetical protein, variant [Aphanomyces invadans]|eukprot:XP_008865960.1 hypothetical protein H310_03758 [Aphanomyces invadans]
MTDVAPAAAATGISMANQDAVAITPLPQKEAPSLVMDGAHLKDAEICLSATSVPTELVSPAVLSTSDGEASKGTTAETVTRMVDEIKGILNSSPSKIPVRKGSGGATSSFTLDDKNAPPPAPTESDVSPSKRKSVSPSQKDEIAHRLYAKAMELKEKRDNLYRQPKEECTFKPTINRTASKREDSSEKDRFLALHEQAEDMARRKEELKQSLEAQFTYKPEISNLSRRLSARHDTDVSKSTSRVEELYKNHQEIEAKREEKKKELEKKDAVECTFQPKINKKTKSPPKQPLYDAELLKQKRLEKERKKAELEMTECSFKPQTSAKGKTNDKSFFDRLQEANKKKVERLEALRKAKEERIEQEATFRPAINDSKVKASKAMEKVPFHERLFNKELLQSQAVEREQKKIELESQECTFKPEIIIAPTVSLERRGSIFNRLFEETKKKQEMLELAEQEKLKKEMEECTFKPQVLVDPALILKEVPQEPVWERLSNDKKQILEDREKRKEELEQQGCTFKPNILGNGCESTRRLSMRRPSSPTLQRSPSKSVEKPTDAIEQGASSEATSPSVTGVDDSEPKAILTNLDSWAASFEEKMQQLQ